MVVIKIYRFGVGKKGMENICLEELRYLSEEIRRNNVAFDISVRRGTLVLESKLHQTKIMVLLNLEYLVFFSFIHFSICKQVNTFAKRQSPTFGHKIHNTINVTNFI